jgi:flavodoxin I
MKNIGLFYGTETAKTAQIAKKIQEAFGETPIEVVDVEKAWQQDFEKYDYIIAGVSTWFDGELPSYWDELVPLIKTLKLKNKKVAIFGLGDQVKYPDNFVDAIGLLAQVFESAGAKIVGYTSTDGYQFGQSQALVGNQFKGLAIDFENQPGKTKQRITNWVKGLKEEFKG